MIRINTVIYFVNVYYLIASTFRKTCVSVNLQQTIYANRYYTHYQGAYQFLLETRSD